MAKVAISLPDDLLRLIEERRRDTGESRSEFLRRSVEQRLRLEQEREWDRQYIEAYRRVPETSEDAGWSEAGLVALAAANPWDESDEPR